MRPPLLLALFAFACGSDPPPTTQTELLLTVTFSRNDIDELRTTGTALAQNRAFGPFDSKGSSVVSGCTISLLFDPADSGTAMVCIEGRAAGAVTGKTCKTFEIDANALRTGTIALDSAPPDPMSCMDLDACCHNLPGDQQPACQDIVQAGNLYACAARVASLEQANVCH